MIGNSLSDQPLARVVRSTKPQLSTCAGKHSSQYSNMAKTDQTRADDKVEVVW